MGSWLLSSSLAILYKGHYIGSWLLSDRTHGMQTRKNEKYKILHAYTERFKNSTVPYIQRMLSDIEEKGS